MIKYPMGFKGPVNQLQQFVSEKQGYLATQKLLDDRLIHWKFHEESSMAEAHFDSNSTIVKAVIHWPPEEGLGTCTCQEKSSCWHLIANAIQTKSRVDQLPPFIQQIQLAKNPHEAFNVWLNQQEHDPYPTMAKHRLIYIIKQDEKSGELLLCLHKGYISPEEKYSLKSTLEPIIVNQKPLPKFVTLTDQYILLKLIQLGHSELSEIKIDGIEDSQLIEMIVETKRSFWRSCYRTPLIIEESGQTQVNNSFKISERLIFSPQENTIYKNSGKTNPTKPIRIANVEQIVPELTLKTKDLSFHLLKLQQYQIDYLELKFSYKGIKFGFEDISNGKIYPTQDLLMILLGFHHQLDRLDSVKAHYETLMATHFHDSDRFIDDDFLTIAPTLLALQQDGWSIQIKESYKLNRQTADDIYVKLNQNELESKWFELELGITIEGEPVNLLPLLKKSIKSQKLTSEFLSTIELKNGAKVNISKPFKDQICKLLEGLVIDTSNTEEVIKLSKNQLLQFPELRNKEKQEEPSNINWSISNEIEKSITNIKTSYNTRTIELPKYLNAELREYQIHGVAWMQFLRKNHFSGILADDMGLGKTLQTLAHILIEKKSGRMKHPALVVVPTSLIGNWKNEITKFTPELTSIILRGANRFNIYPELQNYDVVILSYGTLIRDVELLQEHKFHLQILDEAQAIKNAKTQKAKSVQSINSSHKLCLTGTPIENHLGEIWSQFHFLMPGFLGTESYFTDFYKKPIEKENNEEKHSLLAHKLTPFMLRRTKSEVAQELPDKVEIMQWIDMPEDQKNTYETIRLMVSEEVQKVMSSSQQNQFLVTNALLRLRQVCCHPKLIDDIYTSIDSAKMQWLATVLPQMIEEGRRILIFSSFKKMLDIISKQLEELDITYHKLTGQTPSEKRSTLVDSFQNKEVPIFLISLKAGGSGLNLTTADTVIHYDPWWNPAAENQASDRAHRIGQDKKVFVYKLICRSTVEEKIHLMQKQKQELADGFLSKKNQNSQFTEEQWQDLLKSPSQ